jgi:FtsZ-binding cell division protein ZapB
VTEEDIKTAFVTAFNKLVTERAGANVASRSCASTSASCASEEIAANARLVRQTLCDTTELEQEKVSLQQELAVLVEMTQNCIAENARIAQDQREYQKRYNDLVERYEKAKARFDEVTEAQSSSGQPRARGWRGSSGCLRHRGRLWRSSMNGSGARWWTM